MWIALLGPLEAAGDDGRALPVAGSRLRGLLALLALDAGHWVSADRVGAALWPGGPVAANTVQSLVSRLRGALGDRELIASGPGGYRLGVAPDDVDAHRFARLAEQGRRALADDAHGRAAADLREALDLWRTDRPEALDGVADDAVARLLGELAEARLDLADAELGLGRAAPILPELRERAAAQPLAERAQAQLMRALAATGRQSEALAVFDATRRRLADELGVDPSPLLTETHRTVLRGKPVAVRRDNLPAAITSFIGRGDDLAAIGALLDSSRLVTLTGPGGAGKTRLAVSAAAVETGGDVRLVELAPVADPAEIPTAVMTALDLQEPVPSGRRGVPAAGDPVERIAAALRRRPVLLVVDNCEHLVDAAAAITARLLARCPELRVLATSREPLGITGEALYPVAPLPYPALARTVDDALAYPAVRLLAERARAARPDFAVTEANLGAVLDICRRLDGLPLAIELAAARLRAMTPAEVAARLGERFRLLTGGDRAALPRHRTLRAVVDWSWELLTGPERELLALMSVFAGGATLDAVEAVAGTDTVDALTSLVDKSLVVHGADGRYRLLETIREYGAERLTAGGAAEDVHRRHAAHYLSIAEREEPRTRTSAQRAAIAALSADYDNILGALRWAVAHSEGETAVRIIAALGWYWWLRGRHIDRRLATDALALGDGVAPAHLALAHAGSAFNTFDSGDSLNEMLDHVERALALRDEHDLGAAYPQLRMLDLLSAMINMTGDGAVEATAHILEDPDPWARAAGHSFHGALLVNAGRLGRAIECFERAKAAFEDIGDHWGLSFVVAELAEISLMNGDLAAAGEAFDRAVALEDEIGADFGFSQMRIRRAAARALTDPPGRATALLRRTLVDARAAGEANNTVHAGVALADHLRRLGDLDGSAEALDLVAPDLARCLGPPHQVAIHQAARARLAVLRGEPDAAELAREAVLSAAATGDGPILARALEASAEAAFAGGEPERAARMLAECEVVLGGVDRSSPEAGALTAGLRAALGERRFEEIYAGALAQDRAALVDRLGEGRPPWTPDRDMGQDSFAR
ncbi:BTAD domain-containing putative transcriptional regulator [Phytomonospora sp. NPDC050363]|uniref:BTAD domain-containing putative transcriptional regulator n=1 Tax=Phytomonospora sp. NPDC050363 TaxID=3155642 RepID=UPI0033E14805